jgi:hypothetical protein
MPRFKPAHPTSRVLFFLCLSVVGACAGGGPTSPTFAGPATTAVPAPSQPAPDRTVAPLTTLGPLAIDSFEMLEVQYQDAGRWYYAPRIHVTSSSDQPITVTSIVTHIDLPLFKAICTTSKLVVPNGARDLYGVTHGDFELTMDKSNTRAPEGTAASAEVYYIVGDTGEKAIATATTTVKPGALPPYGTDTLAGSCR